MCGRCTIEPTARFYERFQVTNRLESWWHNIADQGIAADALQRPLVPRSRFRARLSAGVGQTRACP
jgi:hypothetical protein